MIEDSRGRAAFRHIPYMGVIHVLSEAMKLGFRLGDPSWSNLGQGQPEFGEMEGAPARIDQIPCAPEDHSYGPINGTDEARQSVADHYNRLFRQGHSSQYGIENVSLGCGGRLILTRIFSALRTCRLGHKNPDYTAYQDLMEQHLGRLELIALPTVAENGFTVEPQDLERAVTEQELDAFLISNPCNPTGMVVQGDDLSAYVRTARNHGCTLLLDEFYSHFIFNPEGGPGSGPVSGAEFVEDVDTDPVILVDGLTKSFRYPGWRVGWAVGPADMIDLLGRAASSIDGGPSRPLQSAMIKVLEAERADQECDALRNVFARKRDIMISRLEGMGCVLPRRSDSTFYVWANLEELPAALNTGEGFFREALKHKVITVPGEFFDVNPAGARPGDSPLSCWMRFSFGPQESNVLQGLDRLEEMVRAHR